MNQPRDLPTPQPDGYILARCEREYRRLAVQAQVWERATQRVLDEVVRRSDTAALDVGCGTGDAMRLIAERINRSGTVTGLDIDAQLGAAALQRLTAQRPDCYRFVAGDVTQVEWVPESSFDLVFARLLLFHVARPAEVLQRLWSWVRPGGALLVMDYDITGARSCPQHPIIERALRVMNDAFRRGDRDIEIGTRMPELFLEANIGMPDACQASSVIIPGTPSTSMLRDVVSSLRATILSARIADEHTLDRIDRELRKDQFASTFMRWPDLVATWKRKGL